MNIYDQCFTNILLYSSTKILAGIADARKEIRTSERLDVMKEDDSILSVTYPAKLNEKHNVDLNETLIPDSHDEEDMMIDSEERLQDITPQRLANIEDLYKLFEDVWYIIYRYTCRYAISLNLDIGNKLPSPSLQELPPEISPKTNLKHLNQLTNGVAQLTKYLNE